MRANPITPTAINRTASTKAVIKKAVLGAVLAGSLLGTAACGGGGAGQAGSKPSAPASAPASASAGSNQPDLHDVPAVVAQVNDEQLTKKEFGQAYTGQYQQAAMQAQQSGQPVDQAQLKKQVAESMVGTMLLSQEADRRGFRASEKDVDKTLTELAKQNGLKSGEEFLAALEKQGMKPAEVRDQVADQVTVDELMAKEGADAKPTEAELKKLYRQAKEQQQAGGQQAKLPPYEKVRSQLAEQAKTQKKNEIGQKLITSLRKKGDVKINL